MACELHICNGGDMIRLFDNPLQRKIVYLCRCRAMAPVEQRGKGTANCWKEVKQTNK